MTLPTSDEEILLLHNPRGSKSRAARELLEARRVSFTERRYLEAPLSRDELAELARRLERPVREWLRAREAAEAGVPPDADEPALLAAMARHPVLMERPILVRGSRAVVGRPPEKVLDLL
jgi:arsenate reductase